MKRLIWFLIFVAGLPVAAAAFPLKRLFYDLLIVFWCILYDEEINEQTSSLSWWLRVCAERRKA